MGCETVSLGCNLLVDEIEDFRVSVFSDFYEQLVELGSVLRSETLGGNFDVFEEDL